MRRPARAEHSYGNPETRLEQTETARKDGPFPDSSEWHSLPDSNRCYRRERAEHAASCWLVPTNVTTCFCLNIHLYWALLPPILKAPNAGIRLGKSWGTLRCPPFTSDDENPNNRTAEAPRASAQTLLAPTGRASWRGARIPKACCSRSPRRRNVGGPVPRRREVR